MIKPELRYVGNFDLDAFVLEGINTVRIPIAQAEAELADAEYWYLDTEAYAKNFDPNPIREAFLKANLERKGKLTKADTKSADKHVENERSKIVLDTRKTTIRLLQIMANDVVYIMDTYRCDISNIARMLPDKKVTCQNGKFDLKIFMHNWDVYPAEVYDTMLGHRMIGLTETPVFFRSRLQEVVKRWTGFTIDKSHGKSDWGKEITSEMLLYAYYDVIFLPEIVHKQITRLNHDSVRLLNKPYFKGLRDSMAIVEMKFLRELCVSELAGIPINSFKLKSIMEETRIEYEDAMVMVRAMDINPESNDDVIGWCATKGVTIGDTTEVTLKSIVDTLPDVAYIMKARKTATKISDIKSYLDVAEDDRIYPSFNQIKAGTGRMSVRQPNTQKIPRSIKNVIYANMNGNVVSKCDYPAIEPRIMSVYANDDNLKRAFIEGHDPYKWVASMINDKPIKDITAEERQRAKAILLGFQYGMGVDTFIAYAKDTFGVIFTHTDASKLKRKFFEAFPRVKNFHNTNAYYLNMGGRIITETPLGRRAYVDTFTRANNFPIQGGGADVIKIAVIEYGERCRAEGIYAPVVNYIHDEAVTDKSKKIAERADQILKDCMEFAADMMLKEFHTECEIETVED